LVFRRHNPIGLRQHKEGDVRKSGWRPVSATRDSCSDQAAMAS
jgi:hypothetical protein